jgi:glucosyltransferase Lgt1/2/3
MSKYIYDPHKHVKIWISNNPAQFMNLENQVRLIEMREKNSKDIIHLVYDSTTLTPVAFEQLHKYCAENRIIPIDADTFKALPLTEEEQILFKFYKEELDQVKTGGNLAVASDILRWLSPVYTKGSYTDFDFPVDTTSLPLTMELEAPLLLNIGSLRMRRQEFILANNDFIAIAVPEAATEQIKLVQKALISRLALYDTDFIEQTEAQLKKTLLNTYMLKFMKNRSESLYILKSKEIYPTPLSSLKIRSCVKQIMTHPGAFIEFNRGSPQESDKAVIQRLRNQLKLQRTLIKYLFFFKEYVEISDVLQRDDECVLAYIMQKELNLYMRSIVVCTTGPIQISKALFGGYIVEREEFIQNVRPLSFNQYGLRKAFQSQNSIPMHESLFGMLRFLGTGEGVVNDSSWLDSGRQLQELRALKLIEHQQTLLERLPNSLMELRNGIRKQIEHLSGTLFKERRIQKKETLEKILACFSDNVNHSEFDVTQFQSILVTSYFNNQTQRLIQALRELSHEAVIFNLTQNRRIIWPAQAFEQLSQDKEVAMSSRFKENA